MQPAKSLQAEFGLATAGASTLSFARNSNRMTSPVHKLTDLAFVWLYKKNMVGSFDGIPLVSLNEGFADFVSVISRALELIRDHDPRRFYRVKKQTHWLVDRPHPSGFGSGAYQHRIKATNVDFEFRPSVGDELFHAAYFAGIIVHEATHGVIRDRCISTTPENRIQVERICRAEENRFLGSVMCSFPHLPAKLIRPFDPEDWNASWETGRFASCLKELKRGSIKSRREQGVTPNA